MDKDTIRTIINATKEQGPDGVATIANLANKLLEKFHPDTAAQVLYVALNPPDWIRKAQSQVLANEWTSIVLRGNHVTYGGAVAHLNNHLKKLMS